MGSALRKPLSQGQPVSSKNDVNTNIDIATISRGTIHLNSKEIEFSLPLDPDAIRLDIQGFRESTTPDLIWVECKGDDAKLKDLLADFTSLLLVISEYGGQAILACPPQSYKKITAYQEFLDKLQNNIGKGQVQIFNVESNQQ